MPKTCLEALLRRVKGPGNAASHLIDAYAASVSSNDCLELVVLTQFPRASATRLSRENRFTLFLELL